MAWTPGELHCTTYLTSWVDGVTDLGMDDKKKLFAQDTIDLVNLHSSTTENAFMGAIRNRLDISPARHAISQPTVFVVHFDITGRSGGVTTYFSVDHREVVATLNGSGESKLSTLLKMKATMAANSMVDHILETGARRFAWDRASRWQRLKWAWKGLVQSNA